MSVLTIRAGKRFAVCAPAEVERPQGKVVRALLIELSLEGCRIGNVAGEAFTVGEAVAISVDGAEPFQAEVRGLGQGTVGLRLTRPFHIAELGHLIATCRAETGEARRLRA